MRRIIEGAEHERSDRPWYKRPRTWIIAFAALVALGAIADDEKPEASQTSPTTTLASRARLVAATSTTETKAPAVAATLATVNTAPSTTAAPVLMPNVICMNLQEAQDLIQERGVFFSRSRDATGRGRKQWLDSNWRVIGQSPGPGARIDEGEAVLSVVKYGESTRGIC